jgi:hypothetical protein
MPVIKQVKKITMEFTDGTTRTVELPEDSGFLREDFTYPVKDPYKDVSGVQKWGGRITTYTIFWAENERVATPT